MNPAYFRRSNVFVVCGVILAAIGCCCSWAPLVSAAPVNTDELATVAEHPVNVAEHPANRRAIMAEDLTLDRLETLVAMAENPAITAVNPAITAENPATSAEQPTAEIKRTKASTGNAVGASSTGDCTAKLSVMSYNTRQLPKFLLFNDWDQDARLQRLPETLRQPEYQADILILEELMTQPAYEKVLTLSDIYPYITTVVGKDCSGKDLNSITGPCSKIFPRSGVMALSKIPILETHGLIYKYAAAGTWDAKCNKGAIYLKVSVNGLPVHVVGTHVQADEGEVDGGPTRLLQIQRLREWMGTFPIPKEEPIILAGDINTKLGSQEQHSIFDGHFVFNFVKHDFSTFSAATNWLARADAYAAKQSLYGEKHLDYIATWTHHLQPIRPAFMTILKLKAKAKWYWRYLEGWWILHEGLFHHDGYYEDVSDHYPVVAKFEFPVNSCSPAETNSLEDLVILLDDNVR